jgi:hypothetical protein
LPLATPGAALPSGMAKNYQRELNDRFMTVVT